MSAPLVLLAAGGTGGHMFPAEALASELQRRGYRIGLITDGRGKAFGGNLADVETVRIRAGGIAGKSLPARIMSVFALGWGALQAYRALKQLQPAAVIGFGGYASVPTMMAATFAGFATAIHEQNALLGRANRLLAGRVAKVATSFALTRGLPDAIADKITVTGMPVRPAIAAQADATYPTAEGDGPLHILVLGGSQGATVLSEVVPAALARLDASIKARLHVTQQCRAEDLSSVEAAYSESGVTAELAAFIDDVPQRLAAAHLMISRSGASTVAEALAVGRPAILVPYPFAADDHQTFNAQAVDGAGAGWIMPQDTFTAENLAARLDSLLGLPAVLSRAAASAAEQSRADAAGRLADMVEDLIATQGRARS